MRFTFNVITVDHHKIFKVLHDYFLKKRLLKYVFSVKKTKNKETIPQL